MEIATQIMLSKTNLLKNLQERFAHFFVGLSVGLSVGILSYFFAYIPFNYMQNSGWSWDAIYSSVFDLSTVYTALLFGFVTYFKSSQSRFLKAISKRLFDGAISYAEHAFKIGLILIVVSIPFIVIEPLPASACDLNSVFFAVWFGLTVSAVGAFLRASKLFWILMSGDQEK